MSDPGKALRKMSRPGNHDSATPAGPVGIPLEPRQRVVSGVDLRIGPDGAWFHEGGPIERPELVRLFAGVLRRDRAGAYWLVTPVEVCPVRVDDAPFVAVEMAVDDPGPDQVIRLRTNLDAWVAVDETRPIRVAADAAGAPRPYVVTADDGTEALIARPVYYELADMAEERRKDGRTVYAVRSAGRTFVVGQQEKATA